MNADELLRRALQHFNEELGPIEQGELMEEISAYLDDPKDSKDTPSLIGAISEKSGASCIENAENYAGSEPVAADGLTQKRLLDVLSYDKSTGIFVWAADCGHQRAGQVAGTVTDKGYLRIWIDGKRCYAHRLAWLYVYGVFPPDQIDHINGVKVDNRIANLRLASQSENQQNRSITSNNILGFQGVRPSGAKIPYRAEISVDGKTIQLGLFHTPEEAHDAYLTAKREMHPFFEPVRPIKPMTEEEIEDRLTDQYSGTYFGSVLEGVRMAERHHGIGKSDE